MIFDTHAHYDDEAFDADRQQVLESLKESRVAYVVNVGASMEGVRASAALAARYPFVYNAAGIHPDEVGCMDEEAMEYLRQVCRQEKTVAVGEIGLDQGNPSGAEALVCRAASPGKGDESSREHPQPGRGGGYPPGGEGGARRMHRRGNPLLFRIRGDG